MAVCDSELKVRIMVVAEDRLKRAVDALRRMGARRVLIFGSCLDAPDQARDVDIAVEGIPVDWLLDADVAVHEILEAPTDLVSREENPNFYEIVEKRGRVLFASA